MLNKQYVQGTWSQEQNKLHINCLELEAVLLIMKHFITQLRGQNVFIRSDNTTVIQFLIREGGTRSTQLCYKTLEIYKLAIQNSIGLNAAHIAGKLNIIPDQLSRVRIRQIQRELDDAILDHIFKIWDKPFIDLFASSQNRKMRIFCTLDPHPEALAMDALTISWEGMFAYAFPPICLIPSFLEHMKQFRCRLILIAPQWPRRHWYTTLL